MTNDVAADVMSWVETATMAPSVHNSQPWLFHIDGEEITVFADPARRLPVVDPDGVEQRISCGAAICNLQLAMAAAGWKTTTDIYPDPTRPNLLAIVRPAERQAATAWESLLHQAIPSRRTNRVAFLDTTLTEEAERDLHRAGDTANTWLFLTGGPLEVEELSRVIRQAHRVQRHDPAFQAEAAAWSGTRDGRGDGIPAAGAGHIAKDTDPLPFREFIGAVRPTVDLSSRRTTPVLAVLGARGAGPGHDVLAGIALQRVLLAATNHGLAASFFPQAMEVPGAAADFTKVVTGLARRVGTPRTTLALGRATAGVQTPRRDPADVIC